MAPQWLKNHLAGTDIQGADAPATDSRRCICCNDCNGWLVVAGYWGALRARWQPCVLVLTSPDRINGMSSGSLPALWGISGRVRFFTGRALLGRCSVSWSYRGCACRSCHSYLEILGSQSGHFAGVFGGIMEAGPLRETNLERFGLF